MSIAEYQLALKNLIDATNDESTLKRWKEQLEADLQDNSEKNSEGTNSSSMTKAVEESKVGKQDHNSDYVVIESGLGIDE